MRPICRKVLIFTALAVLGIVGWRSGDILLGRNLDTITAGQAYRSAQLSGPTLSKEIAVLGLRSVINLRGSHPADEWYRDEIATCHAAGIAHYDVRMSATRLPEPETVALLIRTFRETPRPFLVHCKSGADRTGLATTLWLIMNGEEPSKAAFHGLTWWHGHIPIGRTRAMDRVLRLYRETGQGMSFEQWARNVYPAVFLSEARR